MIVCLPGHSCFSPIASPAPMRRVQVLSVSLASKVNEGSSPSTNHASRSQGPTFASLTRVLPTEVIWAGLVWTKTASSSAGPVCTSKSSAGEAPDTAVTSMNKSASVKRLTSNAVLPPRGDAGRGWSEGDGVGSPVGHGFSSECVCAALTRRARRDRSRGSPGTAPP